MAQITGQNLPVPQSKFVNSDQTLSYDGYQFFLAGLNAAITAVSTNTIATGLTATGTNQATALQLSNQWNEVDAVPSGTGVLLSSYQPGQSQVVFNEDAINSLNVFPPPGMAINALAANAAFVLAAGLRATFNFISATQIRT